MRAQLGADEVLALGDRDNDGVVDAGVLERALDAASAEMDGYLAERYALPLSSVSPMLVQVCVDVARYRLVGSAATETETARNRYQDAVAWLVKVRKGEVLLSANGVTVAAPGANTAQLVGGSNAFSRDQRGL